MLPDQPTLPRRRCDALDEIRADLSEFGVSLLEEVSGPGDLLRVTEALGTTVPQPDSRPDDVTVIEDRHATGSSMAGFSRRSLYPHTDRSSVDSPPGLVLAAYGSDPLGGGEALLVDGQEIFGELAATAPEALAALCAPRTALFGGAGGYLGNIFDEQREVVTIRLRMDGLVRFAPTITEHLPVLRAAIERHARVVPMVTGTGYVVNNRRWLHGRNSFVGPRLIYRVTANPYLGLMPAGFRPELSTRPMKAAGE